MTLDVAFWVLAVMCVGTALAVVFVRDVFRAALFLILCFFTVAGIYITLNADFLAAVQVLIYVGAVSVLLIFAIMLTRDAKQGSPSGRLRIPALIIGLALLGVMISSILSFDWQPSAEMSDMVRTQDIAGLLFSEGGFVLAFEIAGLMLLAAIIGAIVLLREK
jgi:NADH-quinone oxidoreductase subunit J